MISDLVKLLSARTAFRRSPAAFVLVCLGLTAGCTEAPRATSPAVETSKPSPYEKMVVRRPGPTPEDGKVYVVQQGKKHWVVNAEWFPRNGYRFPEDVREIPASELERIPAGEPIQ